MSLTDTYAQYYTYPTVTDVPNIQTVGQSIADIIVPRSVMRFNSASHRGGVITNPAAGMVTWLADVKRLEVYDGYAWQAIVAATRPWANVALPSGYAPWEGNTVAPRVRREGSIVYLEGRMKKTSAQIPASDSLVIGTLPAGYWPVDHYAEGFVTTTNASNGTPLARIEIWHTDGKIRYYSDRSTDWVGFSSWWFVN